MGDEWGTPQNLFNFLNDVCGGFDIDVCANINNKKVDKYYDKYMDGLNQEWNGICWCNPPYSNILPWVEKAIKETEGSVKRTCVYMLIPTNTDTSYFEKIFSKAQIVIFIKGRLKFEGEQNYPARFPTCIVIFDSEKHWEHIRFWLMDRDTFEVKRVSDLMGVDDKERDIIWASGLFDGEGCIMITRRKGRKKQYEKHHLLEVSLSMIHEETVKKFHEIINLGSIRLDSNVSGNRREIWRWTASSQKAYEVLLKLEPYLITKKEQLLIGKEFYEKFYKNSQRYYKLPKEICDEREKYYWKMRELKWL